MKWRVCMLGRRQTALVEENNCCDILAIFFHKKPRSMDYQIRSKIHCLHTDHAYHKQTNLPQHIACISSPPSAILD